LDALESLKKFVHNTNFWWLKPDDNILPPGPPPSNVSIHGMSNPPYEYVVSVIVPFGVQVGGFGFQLRNIPEGTYSAEWYFPQVGIGSFLPNDPFVIQHDAFVNVPTFTDQIALHLKKIP
jgi:hypothetical protein